MRSRRSTAKKALCQQTRTWEPVAPEYRMQAAIQVTHPAPHMLTLRSTVEESKVIAGYRRGKLINNMRGNGWGLFKASLDAINSIKVYR